MPSPPLVIHIRVTVHQPTTQTLEQLREVAEDVRRRTAYALHDAISVEVDDYESSGDETW